MTHNRQQGHTLHNYQNYTEDELLLQFNATPSHVEEQARAFASEYPEIASQPDNTERSITLEKREGEAA